MVVKSLKSLRREIDLFTFGFKCFDSTTTTKGSSTIDNGGKLSKDIKIEVFRTKNAKDKGKKVRQPKCIN
jgi:hypothetical protein